MKPAKVPTKGHGNFYVANGKSKNQPDLFALWGKTPTKKNSQDSDGSIVSQPVFVTPPPTTIDLVAESSTSSSLTPDSDKFEPPKSVAQSVIILQDKAVMKPENENPASTVKSISETLAKESVTDDIPTDLPKESSLTAMEVVGVAEPVQSTTAMEIVDPVVIIVEEKDESAKPSTEEPEMPKKRKRVQKPTEKPIVELDDEQKQSLVKFSSILHDLETKYSADSLLLFVKSKLKSEFESKTPNPNNENEISEYIGLYVEGSSLPLSTLSSSLSQLLSLPVDDVSSKLKRMAIRVNNGSMTSPVNIYEDTGDHDMLVWEVSRLDLLSPVETELYKLLMKMRQQIKRYGSALKIIAKSMKICNTSTGSDLGSKSADSESKIFKIFSQIDGAIVTHEKAIAKNNEKMVKSSSKLIAKAVSSQEMKVDQDPAQRSIKSFFSTPAIATHHSTTNINSTTTLPSSSGSRNLLFDDSSSRSLSQEIVKPLMVQVTVTINDPTNSSFCELKTITISSRFKLLSFSTNHRPAYYGSFSKRSTIITGRRPFARDDKLVNYYDDSDEDWVSDDDAAGEDIGDDDDDDDDDGKTKGGDNPDLDYDDGWLLHDNEMHADDVLNEDGHLASVLMSSSSSSSSSVVFHSIFDYNDNHMAKFETFVLREPDFKSMCQVNDDDDNDVKQQQIKIARLKELNDGQTAHLCQMIHGTKIGMDKIISNMKEFLASAGMTESCESAGGIIKRTVLQIADKTKLSENSSTIWIVKPDVALRLGLILVVPTVEEKKKTTTPRKGEKKSVVSVAPVAKPIEVPSTDV